MLFNKNPEGGVESMYKKFGLLNRNFVWLIFGMILLVTAIGCSGFGSCVVSSPDVSSGVFIDSPVAGITYKTPTLECITDAAGTFQYKKGEKVTFSIGTVILGSAIGKPVLTPLDIVDGAKDTSDQRVNNISAFLQTLDQDGNPANGITISSKTVSFVDKYGSGINFNQNIRAFSFDPGFRSVMSELNEVDAFGDTPRAVMSPTVAKKHLDNTLSKLKK
jgi:para-nitrobenzyl esterase